MAHAPTFDDVLDTITAMPADDQEDLVRIVQRRLSDQRRAKLVADVLQAHAEFARGEARIATVEEIMREITK